MKLETRVENLEKLAMPTLKDFFIELEKADPDYCLAIKEALLKGLDSPKRGETIIRPKEAPVSFFTKSMAVIRAQSDPETALPLFEFRRRLGDAVGIR